MDNHAHSHDFLNTESLPCYPPTDIIRNSDWREGVLEEMVMEPGRCGMAVAVD
jgi:hypothetical protein